MAQTTKPVNLQPSKVEAFDAYIRQPEEQMEHALKGSSPFSGVISARKSHSRSGPGRVYE